MPRPQALRRLPLREAIQSLKNGEGSTPFPAGVKSLSFRYLARNSEPGPRDFVRTIAPRIAYANPAIPFSVQRFPDQRSDSKNPNSPDAAAKWENEEKPGATMVIEFVEGPDKVIPARHLSAQQIWKEVAVATGLPAPSDIPEPAAAAPTPAA